jgi:hypothetical protein
MGKKFEKHFKENELFCFWGSERALPISDKRFGRERPGEHSWAAKPHKHPGRSRPNRGFRPRSFFGPPIAQAIRQQAFISTRRRTRRVCFDQNTACVSVFWFWLLAGGPCRHWLFAWVGAPQAPRAFLRSQIATLVPPFTIAAASHRPSGLSATVPLPRSSL